MGNEQKATVKGHGLNVGDRFDFYGLATDAIPASEPTRVELGKVGNKYMITTVHGEVMTWEFGATAKIWADTSVKHAATVKARTLDNGDTVYVGRCDCERDWMTGFHTSETDAREVAMGHGSVSRPLYEAPKANPFKVGDVVSHRSMTATARPVKSTDGDQVTVEVFGRDFTASADTFKHATAETPALAEDLPQCGQWIMWQGFSYMVEARYSDGRMNLKPYGGYQCVIPDRPIAQLMAWGEVKWPT